MVTVMGDEAPPCGSGSVLKQEASCRILQEAITYVRELKGMKGGTSQDDEDGTNEDMQFEMEDVAESEGGAKPSHNEVEQRRRLLAKQYFDELRSLLPNAAKFDKNTVLVRARTLNPQPEPFEPNTNILTPAHRTLNPKP